MDLSAADIDRRIERRRIVAYDAKDRTPVSPLDERQSAPRSANTGRPKGVPAPIASACCSLEDVMIQFDRPTQAKPDLHRSYSTGNGFGFGKPPAGGCPQDNNAPAREDGIAYLSRPAAPFPRLFPGL